MSTASSSYQQTPVRVNRTKFLVSSLFFSGPSSQTMSNTSKIVQWGGVVLSILLFLLRILVRLKVFRRLYVDDGLVFFAWTLLLTNTIVWQLSAKTLYQLSAVATGAHSPPPADFAQSTEILWPKGLVVIILFLTGLWSIKLSFLVFFKRLGNGIRHQEKIWWAVLVLTVASYLSTFGTIPYSCLTGSFQDILSKHYFLMSMCFV